MRRRPGLVLLAAIAALALGASPATAAADDGEPALGIAHLLPNGMNLWEVPLAVEDPGLGTPQLVTSLTTGGFSYAYSRTETGDFGDVTGTDDGSPDWLVSHRQPNGGVLLWVVGGGPDTTPRLWADLRGGGWSWDASRQLVGDVNGDGLDDVVSVHRNPLSARDVRANVWVHLNTGTGFAAPALWAQLSTVSMVRLSLEPFSQVRYMLGDVDGDGRDDLVTTDGDTAVGWPFALRHFVHHNTGAGFAVNDSFAGGLAREGWSFAASRELMADVTGDGMEDLVTVHAQGGGGILLWVRPGSGSFVADTPVLMADLRTGGWSYASSRQVAADVDGDGRDDVVSAHDQPGGGMLLWAHRSHENRVFEEPVVLGDLRGGGWDYWSSRASVGHRTAV
ncbi:FG-GAP-like repeat-containing protein [Actinotalea solisilvae]|uniref:FG-GAP-like repeat-containing protein n=1 Tax=Actinotalea solisilvae TaxID=2072922 RepID=UPI0018F1AC42|nr:FG-GAP-like repeat-containing protein [Actinotalea solisilvae]